MLKISKTLLIHVCIRSVYLCKALDIFYAFNEHLIFYDFNKHLCLKCQHGVTIRFQVNFKLADSQPDHRARCLTNLPDMVWGHCQIMAVTADQGQCSLMEWSVAN